MRNSINIVIIIIFTTTAAVIVVIVRSFRVPTPPGKSWIFSENFQTWKVPENEFGGN